MAIFETPVYGIKYIDDNEPLKNIAGVTKQVAERLEKAMGDAQIPPGNPSQNDVLNRLNNLERRAAGRATVTVTNSANGFLDVAFPVGRFSLPPVVMVTKQSDTLAKYVPYTLNITATGFRVGLYSGDGTASSQSVVLGWTAVQMSPTSATG